MFTLAAYTSRLIASSFYVGAFLIKSNPSSFVDVVRVNILGGGDVCGRAIFVGAAMAAMGLHPPVEWLPKTTGYNDFHSLVDTVVKLM